MRPITLSDAELTEVISRLSPTGREFSAARLARLLASEHSVMTVRVNTTTAIGNISDIVKRHINPRIADLNLYVACTKPPYPISNQFGQSSGQMLWSFFKNQSANDDYYDQQDHLMKKLSHDIRELKSQFPLLDLPEDEWVGALQKLDAIT